MSSKIADLTITKGTGSVLTLMTEGKYVNDNKYFNIDVQSGAGTVTIASTDAEIQSDSGAGNISAVIGTKSSTAPSTGYYIKVGASGIGSSTITTAGWLDEGSLGTATASGSFYFPVTAATASISGSNTVTPSASVSGTNVTLSNTNNGISIVATGGGTASASVSATSTAAGYVPNNETLDTATVNATSQTTTAQSYISGVTLTVPETGTRTFSITVPNGNTTATFVFNVDAEGSVTITET